jgi:hypothetical protein
MYWRWSSGLLTVKTPIQHMGDLATWFANSMLSNNPLSISENAPGAALQNRIKLSQQLYPTSQHLHDVVDTLHKCGRA